MVKIRSAYSERVAVKLVCPEKSLTRQSEAAECDINVIMKRYEKTGVLPVGAEGFFADVSEMGDYRQVLETARVAEAVFMQLPAEKRAKFENNVGSFLDFVSIAERKDLVELGLLEAEPEAPPAPPPAPPA